MRLPAAPARFHLGPMLVTLALCACSGDGDSSTATATGSALTLTATATSASAPRPPATATFEPVPIGADGQVCIHSSTPSALRDRITEALGGSGLAMLSDCPAGSELDAPVVGLPGFDRSAPEAAAALAGRVLHSSDGDPAPDRVAVVRLFPAEPSLADIARQRPVVPSLFYCEGHDCAPVQYEVYVTEGMSVETLARRIGSAP